MFDAYNGSTDEVIVDGYLTDIDIATLGFGWRKNQMTLSELQEIKGKVEICWYNK